MVLAMYSTCPLIVLSINVDIKSSKINGPDVKYDVGAK